MPPPIQIRLGRKSDEELRQALESHDALQREALDHLRVRLQRERDARDAVRRDKQLNEYIVRKLETHKSDSTALSIGGASDAFSWRNIEDKRDIDTRIKRFRQTESCEVIDVTEWARSLPEQGTPGSSRRVAKRAKKLNTSRIGAIVEPRRLTSRSMERNDGGSPTTARSASPRGLMASGAGGGASSSGGAGQRASFVASTRSNVSATAREGRASIIGASGRRLEDPRGGRRAGSRRNQPPEKKQMARGIAGLRGQVSNVLLPSLTLGSGITAKGVQQCELDFMMLSYGKSHVLLDTFLDYGTEHVADYGHRRVMFIEFIDYMKRNKMRELPLVHFIHIVHPRWQRSGIPAAVQAHAPNLGWAVGLPFDLAECINHIWSQAHTEPNDEGAQTISFDEFARLSKVESSFALDYADVRQMFYATDEDGNGTLDKHEFARFIAGKVNPVDTMPPEQVVESDGPAIPELEGQANPDSGAEDSGPSPE